MRSIKYLILFIIISARSIFAQISGLSGWDIFLDPGHSQKENMGIYGYSEAEKNLQVALYLRDMLLNTTDIDTVYTSRTNDQQVVSLSQRTDYANRLGTTWFHSIHSDAGAPEYTSTLLLWGQYYNGVEKSPKGGKAMADIMVNLLTRGMRTGTRGSIGDCTFYSYSDYCRQNGGPYLHVNRTTNMASELSEAGFHTNPTQNQLNMNAEFRKLQAQTFFWSILKYHGIQRPHVGICAGIVYDFDTKVPVNGAQITLNGQTYTTDTFESVFNKFTGDPNLLHNGFYYIENLPTATLEMVIDAPNYYSDTLRVTLSDTFYTFQDIRLLSKRSPYVVTTMPAQGDPAFPAWKDIRLEFSRKMDRISVESNIKIQPENTLAFSWSNDDHQLTLKTDTLAFLTDYSIVISGLAKDVYGHPLDGNGDGVGGDDFILHFKSSAQDIAAPKIVATYPNMNALNVELLPIISVIFNELLDSASVTDESVKLERFSDHTFVPGSLRHYQVNNVSLVHFFPSQELAANEIYVCRIGSGFKDLFGNTTTATKSVSFRTSTMTDVLTFVENFETNLTGNWWVPQQSGSTTGIITDATSRGPEKTIINLSTGSTTSLKVSYGWDLSASEWLIRVYLADGAPAKSILFDQSYIVQAYIYGDGSNNKFRFALDDKYPNTAAANHEVSPWVTLNWLGWKLVSWNLSVDGTGTWLGDGNLDGTLRFDSIQLTHASDGTKTGSIYLDDLRLVKKIPVSVPGEPAQVPQELALLQNYPNPFNPETTIRYRVSASGQWVSLEIYNLLGEKIKTLISEKQVAGVYEVRWNGTDDQDRKVASGFYLCKLTSGQSSQSSRMLLVK